jgi:RNA polymerase sigma-70 factor (ECF subfamily)
MNNNEILSIIEGCKNDDNGSFSKLVSLYADRLYGYFYRLTANGDLCEELISVVFVKLVENIKKYQGGSFDGWIFRIASNVFYDYLREKKRRHELQDKLTSEFTEDDEIAPEFDKADGDRLQKSLSKLDAETRELIVLRFYSEASFKEIAQMKGEPIGTVLSKIHRGIKKLKELME